MKRPIKAAVEDGRKIFDNVSTEVSYMIDDALSDLEDNIAQKMSSSVKGYDPEWCPADASEMVKNPAFKKYNKGIEDAKISLLNAYLAALFMDAPEDIQKYV